MGFLVRTNSTLRPFDSMGVITIKMISITSITSTMGVTLISIMGGGALYFDGSFAIRLLSPRNSAGVGGGPQAGPLKINSPDPLLASGRSGRTPRPTDYAKLLAGAHAPLRTL